MNLIEQIVTLAASKALDIIEQEIEDYETRTLAADRVAEVLRQRLLLRHEAQTLLDERHSR